MSDVGRILSKWVASLSILIGALEIIAVFDWYAHDGDDFGATSQYLLIGILFLLAMFVGVVLFGLWVWLFVWDRVNEVECRTLWIILGGYVSTIIAFVIEQNMLFWLIGIAFIVGGVLLFRENADNYF